MPEKTIRLFATLRELAGMREFTVSLPEEASVRDLIDAIGEVSLPLKQRIIDENGAFTNMAYIFLEGRSVLVLDGLDTPIAPETNRIAIFPPMGGG